MIAAPRSRNDPCPCGSGQRYKHCHGAPLAVNRAVAPEAADRSQSQHALTEDALTAEARFHRGNLLREKGDALAAIAEYERALVLEPAHAAILNNLGLALEAAGDRDRAEQCYREVLAMNPQHPDALGNFASVRFEREDYAQAVAAYERLFAI